MRFPALILKNLLRRKTRSSLIILGISIGITLIQVVQTAIHLGCYFAARTEVMT